LSSEERAHVYARASESFYRSTKLIRELAQPVKPILTFGVREWEAAGVIIDPHVRRILLEFPYWVSEDLLNLPCPFHRGKLIRDTHMQFFGIPGITLQRLMGLLPHRFYHDGKNRRGCAFMHQELRIGAYLMLMGPVPHSELTIYEW